MDDFSVEENVQCTDQSNRGLWPLCAILFNGGKKFSLGLEYIRKTCPCNEYPFKPHFYIAKLGYEGVYLFFLFLLQNIDCGYSLEPPQRGGSNVYPQSIF